MNPNPYQFTERELELQRTLREFTAREITPRTLEMDRKAEIPTDLRKKLAELGCYGRILPKEVGGQAGTEMELCIQEEELAYGNMSVSGSTLATCLGSIPVCFYGTKDQQARFLIPVIKGDVITTIGITEPNAGSDAASLQSTAVRDGNDYILNGSKRYIDNTACAQYFTIWAKTDPSAGYKGISTFVVPRNAPGFNIDGVYDLLGMRPLGVGGFSYKDVRVPIEDRIGEEGQGWYHMMRMLVYGRTSTAAMCLGLSQAALDAAKKHALTRQQFGQPIGNFQAIRFKIADMAVSVLTARLLVYHAARLIDSGDGAEREASMAKFYGAETVQRVTQEAVQIHGGDGVNKDYPIEMFFRDARIFSIGEGTSEIHRNVTAKRELGL